MSLLLSRLLAGSRVWPLGVCTIASEVGLQCVPQRCFDVGDASTDTAPMPRIRDMIVEGSIGSELNFSTVSTFQEYWTWLNTLAELALGAERRNLLVLFAMRVKAESHPTLPLNLRGIGSSLRVLLRYS